MANSTVDIPKEIATMWHAYKKLASVFPTESEINCSILDVIAATSETQPQSLAAFGNYLKFMLGSSKEGVLLNPTEDVFNAWYKKT